ncbi:PIN2/TERF1-interacting telomerase inhibitor 1 [Erinaceus europaeus]|uniref:PIN2/TERF1-interacting telomerase inhibitor 1 n=1 Tax=Erinaceus europaeus TaxID=9365 RepID=A0ABM3WWF2_ERIEU|nr:PIN2/TERF1-interacting telomerase inhibitor 1 [Erinaceus europaeus]
MSMLAERRRKQKWAVDPRNTAWSNDESKFGQRMLEKMGWSKGKGLGAQEQGATEHIKVQVKNNQLGLGASINNEDNWIAHQDDFNQLLAELSTCHGQEIADSLDSKEKKSFSLEEKSKVSKKRVHYMKFTKGKDLSSRSKTDLDCIFGKRQSKKISEDDSSPATPDETESSIVTTSAFTIQEYFANRMAALKNKPLAADIHVERKKAKKRKEVKDKNSENYSQPQARKKKDLQQPEDPCGDENAEAAEDREDCVSEDQDFPPQPKKKREKKKTQEQVQAVEEVPLQETTTKKKKKKKKGSK